MGTAQPNPGLSVPDGFRKHFFWSVAEAKNGNHRSGPDEVFTPDGMNPGCFGYWIGV
jgi:hypothetical protein